ncbi:DUF1203 domain-containing protein [Pannonibacter phragmitetus]|uniref:DUF1203 domain-containing protein n=1 Tax=Pannonibacter phragmitetus TaxID=121719 RepID=UPI003D2EEB6C
MTFQIEPLSAERFLPLFSLDDEELAARNIEVHVADADAGYPCRLGLRFAKAGERLLLVNYEHVPHDTPYRASHAIYIVQGAESVWPKVGEVPNSLQVPMLSVRAFDARHRIIDGRLVAGEKLADTIGSIFDVPEVEYIHLHYPGRGCYAACVRRA